MHTEELSPEVPLDSSGTGRGNGSTRRSGNYENVAPAWHGDIFFVVSQLVIKDFKIRYRNMSLGVFWSVLNPIVMMGVLTFVFTKVVPNNSIAHFPVFLMCGLVPFNFFHHRVAFRNDLSSSITPDSSNEFPFPVKSSRWPAVLSNCLHLFIQICLLFTLVFISGFSFNRSWIWLPYLWTMEVIFVCGLSLITSALNVYVRDTRYLVESVNTVLFWLVPVVYSFSVIPALYAEIYKLNPLAALILAMRNILMEGLAPRWELLVKLTLVAVLTFSFGFIVFQRLKRRFYDHL